MLDFVARQVSPDPAQRTRVELVTGQREVPVLVDPENAMVVTEADDIIAYLQETYAEKQAAR
jgi:glutathione S-transferase